VVVLFAEFSNKVGCFFGGQEACLDKTGVQRN